MVLLVLGPYFVGNFMESGRWEIAASPDGMIMTFLTMSMAEICHSFNMRSRRGNIFTKGYGNKALTLAAAGSVLATTFVCKIPALANTFGFTPVSLAEYAVAAVFGTAESCIVELVKHFQRKVGRWRAAVPRLFVALREKCGMMAPSAARLAARPAK